MSRSPMDGPMAGGSVAVSGGAVAAARGPGYWMHETSGVLKPAVLAYLHHEPLSGEHLAALRAYLRQWITAPVWDSNPHAGAPERAWLARMRAAVDQLTSRQAIDGWIDEATANGLDPL